MTLNNKKLFISIYFFLENFVFIILNLMPYFIRNIVYRLTLKHMGKNVYIDHWAYFRYPWRVILGDNVVINRGCKFFCSYFYKDVNITIGNNVIIAPDVTFFAASHDYNLIDLPDIAKSIIIKNHVWIGGKSIILPGVTVEEGSVIGAGSIVTRDVPEWSVVAGNPARVIKKREIK